ncbi:MAG TPA: hypothetical protein VGS80_25130 [Ktedonobacterales bacterium]|nr:hypothetical protein [Ktedonobacterales bacterium]
MQAEARERGVGVLTVQQERIAEAEAVRFADAVGVNALVARYGSYDKIVAATADAERAAHEQAHDPAQLAPRAYRHPFIRRLARCHVGLVRRPQLCLPLQ